jgi:signal transduction histidine kinase
MTGILGLAELLKSQAEVMTPEEIKELSQSLFDSAVRMNQTLEKFWIHTQCMFLPHDQAKLATSRQTGSKEAQRVIKSIAGELASSYKRSADLVMTLSPMSIAISEQYLEQILRQVTDNAFKFSIPGSQVVFLTICENEMGLIIIKDNGRGMSEEQINKIHMFMQFDRERHEQQGLGLGLMIAKRLTEIHDGSIRVVSSLSKGTTVTISFPLLAGK